MTYTRLPEMLSQKLRAIITRDTILIVHFAFTIAALLDTIYIEGGTTTDRVIIFSLLAAFMAMGILRWKRGSLLDRRPGLGITIYVLLGIPVITYLSDVRSYWAFYWIVPMFLASFYYGRRLAMKLYLLLGLILVVQLILNQKYITGVDDYMFVIAVYIIIGAFSWLFTDTLDVTEEDRRLLLETLEKVKSQEEELNALVFSITDAVLTVDPKGIITLYNPATLNLFDTHDNLIGKSFLESANTNGLKHSGVEAANLYSSRGSRHEGIITYRDGHVVNINLSASPIRNSKGFIKGYVLVLRDISDIKALDRSKDEFFSIASHELRTPLTTIRGNASMILDNYHKEMEDKKLREMVEDMHESSIRLIAIVKDFLDVSRLEQNKVSFVFEATDLKDIVDSVVYEMNPLFRSKDLLLRADDNIDKMPKIWVDKDRLREVLYNLVGNSAKFTEKGGATINATLVKNTVRVDITDSGRGVSTQGQKLLFKKFQQAGDSLLTRDTSKGTGLGLYISRMLIEGMHGRIWLEHTSEGSGSRFSFIVPVVTEAQLAKADFEKADGVKDK